MKVLKPSKPNYLLSASYLLAFVVTVVLLLAVGKKERIKEVQPVLDLKKLEKIVTQNFQKSTAPGMVATLYKGAVDTAVLNLELGYGDDEKSKRISTQDHFWIASISKSLIGHAVLQLSDEGLLNMNDYLTDYLPESELYKNTTIEMLGYHTSGIPNIARNQQLQRAVEKNYGKLWKHDELLHYAKQLEPDHPPGTEWTYSNTNTILLAELIQKVTGHDWQDIVRTKILEPLNMTHTGIGNKGVLPAPHSKGYRHAPKKYPFKYGKDRLDVSDWNPSWTGASGSYYSTEKDMALFTRAIGTGRLISEKSKAMLTDWHDTNDDYLQYGFQVWDYFGAMVLMGDVIGYSAFTAYVPEIDTTIVVLSNLCNTPDDETTAASTGFQLLDEIYGIE